MGRYIARRLLETIPLMLIISIFVFMFIHLIPGDPARTLAGVEATPEEIEAIREEFGLNDPLLKQYADYMIGLFKGDMGRSLKSNIPVTELIWSRFQFTIQLVCAGLVWAPFLGIFIGVMCAIKRGTWADLGGMFLAICGLSAPGFWLGLMGIQFFSVKMGMLPSAGLESWKSLVLPSLVMGTGIMAMFRHAFKNSLIQVVTILGLQIGGLLSGSVITENIFSIPGMGRLLVDSISFRDYPVIQGLLMIFALQYVLINLVVDVLYGVINPKIRLD